MSVIPKSGYRFSGQDHAQTKSMIPRVREYLRDVT